MKDYEILEISDEFIKYRYIGKNPKIDKAIMILSSKFPNYHVFKLLIEPFNLNK